MKTTITKSALNEAMTNAGITPTRDGWEFNFRNYITETLAEAVDSMLDNTDDSEETRLLCIVADLCNDLEAAEEDEANETLQADRAESEEEARDCSFSDQILAAWEAMPILTAEEAAPFANFTFADFLKHLPDRVTATDPTHGYKTYYRPGVLLFLNLCQALAAPNEEGGQFPEMGHLIAFTHIGDSDTPATIAEAYRPTGHPKQYRLAGTIGKAKHCISTHDGRSKVAKDSPWGKNDGNLPFWGMEICRNKKNLARRIKDLEAAGYTQA